jgi:hypothetical protein
LTSFPSVAVVILNWNGKRYLEQFLPSVLTTTYPAYRLIVADNASTDDSLLFLAEQYPQIEILRLPVNYGFARGYNEALRGVEADYYLLLNSDVEVTPGWIEPMVELLEQEPRAAACQPKIRAWRNRDLFEYAGAAGGWLDAYGYPFARGRVFDVCEADTGQYDTVAEVFWASGAALLIRSSVYRSLGGFDDYFFAHQEEIDLCWRVQRAGFRVFCHPQSLVFHVGGGTLPRGNSRKTFLNFRNNLIMLAKNLPRSEKWWKIPARLALDEVSAVKGLVSGDAGYFWAIVKAHHAFLYWLLIGRRKGPALPRSTKRLEGYYRGNVVWDHFVKGRTRFSEIMESVGNF